ncbi:unnamed protein product [Gadus morhua 'NCC']
MSIALAGPEFASLAAARLLFGTDLFPVLLLAVMRFCTELESDRGIRQSFTGLRHQQMCESPEGRAEMTHRPVSGN